MKKTKKKYFAVWEGYEPGIYTGWEECKKQIHQFPGAKYMGFETEVEAQEAYLSPYYEVISKNKKEKVKPEPKSNVGIPIWESISVDAACSGSPGKMEYRGVFTHNKKEIFKMGPFPEGTNNIGEFLALVHGIALLKQQNSLLPIYSDSKTAIAWVKKKKAATKLVPNAVNRELFELVARAEKWLRENTYPNVIYKWETTEWGEIPADFGRK